jgi:hypothetical protein
MNNLLNKFNNVKVENIERISKEDKEFCEMHTRAYNETLDCFKRILNDLVDLYNSQVDYLISYDGGKAESYNIYVSSCGDFSINEVIDQILRVQKKYTSAICSYFSRKYNVTIETDPIYRKYKHIEIPYNSRENRDKTYNKNLVEYVSFDYNNIIDEIFVQLGGFTFEEKAIQEIKDATRKIYYYNDYRRTSNITIKNNKMTIDGNYAYKDTIWNEYRLRDNFGEIFTSLYLFDSGIVTDNNTELHNKYCGYRNERNLDNYDKYKPYSLTKVTGIKFFKNGKLEIEFTNSEHAEQFAKEYCGYVEKIA